MLDYWIADFHFCSVYRDWTAKYRPRLARLATLSHWSGLINPVSLTSAYCVGNVDGNTHHPTHLRPQQVADKIGEAGDGPEFRWGISTTLIEIFD
jgi:hypothetical protein